MSRRSQNRDRRWSSIKVHAENALSKEVIVQEIYIRFVPYFIVNQATAFGTQSAQKPAISVCIRGF